MEDVKLFGTWPSPFSQRVIWGLKHKGVDYEYFEEDLSNKSTLLLQYNPVHKKVPVLVHGEKIVSESIVILEYIEETWPKNPLLPEDAYERAVVRFWAKFIDEKIRAMWVFFQTVGKEQEKAIQDNLEVLRTREEYGLGEKKFFGGDIIGLADIALGWIIQILEPMEEIMNVWELRQPQRLLESNNDGYENRSGRCTTRWQQDARTARCDNNPAACVRTARQ
ncbi:hypothetical protein HHK36_022430 [Tetracentron sinense]|uniref:Glutathione S-transferase n=1 Tax=Tetracentron sinense TaxID=13715 RepID=A0A835D9L2_TETSI|nr:hypothetical protein HHK36_022430 [Tetracentron sinense]